MGILPGHDAVIGVVRALHALGIGPDRVSVLARDDQALCATIEEVGATDGREADAPALLADFVDPKGRDEAAGMLVGGGVGLVLGLSAIALPGLGAFLLAAGPVAVALHGLTFAAGGLGIGALIGAIVDEGVTGEHRAALEEALAQGRWIVVAHGEEAEMARAVETLRDAGAAHAHVL